jgi:hypothetical protein
MSMVITCRQAGRHRDLRAGVSTQNVAEKREKLKKKGGVRQAQLTSSLLGK